MTQPTQPEIPTDILFDQLVNRVAGPEMPCTAQVGGQSCCNRMHGKLIEKGPDKGKLKFWFGSDCKAAAAELCDACLMYWHVAVARNLYLNLMRRKLHP